MTSKRFSGFLDTCRNSHLFEWNFRNKWNISTFSRCCAIKLECAVWNIWNTVVLESVFSRALHAQPDPC